MGYVHAHVCLHVFSNAHVQERTGLDLKERKHSENVEANICLQITVPMFFTEGHVCLIRQSFGLGKSELLPGIKLWFSAL